VELGRRELQVHVLAPHLAHDLHQPIRGDLRVPEQDQTAGIDHRARASSVDSCLLRVAIANWV
jgi:hypothetical protein